ncbi:MAG: hypothetical protein NTW29_18925 [Bacteroidetes bacterium]|nr:hypothetical protein [Bacteroidota bacterium]
MKKYLLFLLLPVMLMQGCLKDKLIYTYTMLKPVYKAKSEVYANIKSNAPRAISNPGKIFIYGQYIFLNEVDKGVHVIDNSNPSNPVMKTFIDIPGNLDIAVKGNTLYADLYSDLVVVDITNPLDARFQKFIPHVFPERYLSYFQTNDSNSVIVDWIRKDTTIERKLSGNMMYDAQGSPYAMLSSYAMPSGAGGASGVPGIAGSMARFSIVNDYLYAVNQSFLKTYNITNTRNPQEAGSQMVGWQIETIYPFKDRLFIGSSNGMYIYDITNPATPVSMGRYTHIRACDPVVADDHFAYVTLRNGTACAGFTNELQILNIDNLMAPSLVVTKPMTNPHGLAKDNNLLFICDGKAGIKLYDATNPLNIVLKQNITGMETYDAIAWNKNLLVVASDGLYQYDYTNGTLTQKSKLSVTK